MQLDPMARKAPLRARSILELSGRWRGRREIGLDGDDAPLLAYPAIRQRHPLDHNRD